MSEPSAKEIEVRVRAGMPLAERFATRFKQTWSWVPDQFLSIGHEALVRAAMVFDPKLGVPFQAFAKPFVVGAMHDFVQAEGRETDQEVLAARAASLLGAATDKKPKLDWSAYDEAPAEVRARAARERRLQVQRMVASALMVGDAPITPETSTLDREEVQHAVDTMNKVLADTPREERDVFRLHVAQRKGQKEVVALLGIPLRTVQRYLASFEQRMKRGFVDAGIELSANVERAWFHFVHTVGEGGG